MAFLQLEKKKAKETYIELAKERKLMPIVPFPEKYSNSLNVYTCRYSS